MPINGRLRGIDFCIADIVAALNAANITTVASCCGHNPEEIAGIISLEDGRRLLVNLNCLVNNKDTLEPGAALSALVPGESPEEERSE
jgi:hypothetical protein